MNSPKVNNGELVLMEDGEVWVVDSSEFKGEECNYHCHRRSTDKKVYKTFKETDILLASRGIDEQNVVPIVSP